MLKVGDNYARKMTAQLRLVFGDITYVFTLKIDRHPDTSDILYICAYNPHRAQKLALSCNKNELFCQKGSSLEWEYIHNNTDS